MKTRKLGETVIQSEMSVGWIVGVWREYKQKFCKVLFGQLTVFSRSKAKHKEDFELYQSELFLSLFAIVLLHTIQWSTRIHNHPFSGYQTCTALFQIYSTLSPR